MKEPNAEIKEHLRVLFTDEEKLKLSEKLADKLQEKARVEASKRMAAAQFKRELESIDGELEEMTDLIQCGYKMQNVDCSVYYNDPSPGKKRIVRNDTGEETGVYIMNSNELQMALDLEGREAAEVAADDDDESPSISHAETDEEREERELRDYELRKEAEEEAGDAEEEPEADDDEDDEFTADA